jgi:hypothetical protein
MNEIVNGVKKYGIALSGIATDVNGLKNNSFRSIYEIVKLCGLMGQGWKNQIDFETKQLIY